MEVLLEDVKDEIAKALGVSKILDGDLQDERTGPLLLKNFKGYLNVMEMGVY